MTSVSETALRPSPTSIPARGFGPLGPRARARGTLVGLLIAGLVLASTPGCVTDPYTGERRIAKTAIGGVLGAGVGAGVAAGIAALAGKDAAKAAMIGAGVGALGGAAVGAYMDAQDAKLRRFLEGTGVRVVRQGDQITLVMPSNITFDTDSAQLRSDFLDVLHAVSLVLTEYPKTIIEVMGHTAAPARTPTTSTSRGAAPRPSAITSRARAWRRCGS